MTPRNESLDLTSCDKEPVQLIGGIQTHGYFVGFRLKDKTIYHVSKNIETIAGRPAATLIGLRLDQVFSPKISRQLLDGAAKVEPDAFEVVCIHDVHATLPVAEVLLYDWDGLIAAEFEAPTSDPGHEITSTSQAAKYSQAFVEDLQKCPTLTAAAKLACRAVRSLTGYDRVMMYRYLPTWDGEVIAEDKSAEAHTFLHHRFPATDIPLPARELYLRNRTRQIADSAKTAVSITPSTHYLTLAPLDLSHSKLRAVSPIHLEYLKNMGVTSSFSVAVIVNGQLWGLIACHRKTPTVIPHGIRRACDTIASTFAVVANMLEDLSSKAQRITFEEKTRLLFHKIRLSADPLKELFDKHQNIEELYSATGIALVTTRKVQIAGLSPTSEQTAELADWLRAHFKSSSKTVVAFDNLAEADARWAGISELVCGLIAVFSPDNEETVFLIFRPGLLRTVVWGGDPRKTMEKRQYQGEINPRVSFESWTETVSKHSAPWQSFELQGAEFLRDFVFESLVRRDRLIQELGARLNFDG